MARPTNRAVIWDMDGVIVDTARQHFKAWQEVFRHRGVDFTDEDFRRTFGQRNDAIVKDMLGDRIPRSEIEALNRQKQEIFRADARRNLRPFPGAVELIKLLKEKGFKLALATSGPTGNVNLIVQSLGLESYFDALVSGEDVIEGKPSPQAFLLAAEKLGVKTRDCIVIEDAVAGIAACKNAGMRCMAVTTTHPREKLRDADLIADSLQNVTVEDMERLLTGG